METPSAYVAATRRRSRLSWYLPGSPSVPQPRMKEDMLLRKLTPRNALDFLRYPLPLLKDALDSATAVDVAFTWRAAVAAKKSQEWLDELSDWAWPTHTTSAGFESPETGHEWAELGEASPSVHAYKAQQRRQQMEAEKHWSSTASLGENESESFIGCLKTCVVWEYWARVNQISKEMQEIELEDIKQHVLRNHIMPLSGAATAVTDTNSVSSAGSVVRMDDLSAVLAVIVLQCLPNLSKVAKLLNVWITRLTVLTRLPTFLDSLDAAESELQSAWAAIRGTRQSNTCTRKQFEAVKDKMLPLVSKAGCELDRLLDVLEGAQETLPDSWLDRMETVERSSREWIVAGEQKLRENEWKNIFGHTHQCEIPKSRVVSSATSVSVSDHDDSVDSLELSCVIDDGQSDPPRAYRVNRLPKLTMPRSTDGDSSPLGPLTPREIPDFPVDDTSLLDSVIDDNDLGIMKEEDVGNDVFSALGRDIDAGDRVKALLKRRSAANVLHNGDSVEMARGAADLPVSTIDDSMVKPRNLSTAHSTDVPTSPTTVPESPSPSIIEPSSSFFVETDIYLPSSPPRPLEPTSDAKLQRQISEILQSLPTRIHLAAEPASVLATNSTNQSPQQLRTFMRAGANSPTPSHRPGTPAMTLAPANQRSTISRLSRAQGQRDVKLYHLMRSGEAPIKLFIRSVGESGERVMVRVGGGWADLGEYLKAYACHHRRGATLAEPAKVQIQDAADRDHTLASSKASSPASAAPTNTAAVMSTVGGRGTPAPTLKIPKLRHTSSTALRGRASRLALKPSDTNIRKLESPDCSNTSPPARASSRSRGTVADLERSFGLAGPTSKASRMSEESLAWVETMKQRVRQASAGNRNKPIAGTASAEKSFQRASIADMRSTVAGDGCFGDLGKVGSTKRLYAKPNGFGS